MRLPILLITVLISLSLQGQPDRISVKGNQLVSSKGLVIFCGLDATI